MFTYEEVDLERFVKHLAGRFRNEECVGMEFDDLVAELNYEIVKVLQNKKYDILPLEQMKAVLRTSCDFRISELRYRYYVTHRKMAQNDISIELEICENKESEYSVESTYDSICRVEETRNYLSKSAKIVFDAVILGNNPMLTTIFQESMKESEKKPSNRLKTWQVAEAIDMPVSTVNKAFKEIKLAYAEVMNER